MVTSLRIPTFLALVCCSFVSISCAYRLGYVDNKLAGGYEQVSVPIFKNSSKEPGVEIFFTNALIRQFARSKVASVVAQSLAPVTLVGEIQDVKYVGESVVEANAEKNRLPRKTVLNSQYRVFVTARIRLIRNSDQNVIWEGDFTNDKVYLAPRMEAPGINSANPLYNQSARTSTIAKLAEDMMLEAHDRATENF